MVLALSIPAIACGEAVAVGDEVRVYEDGLTAITIATDSGTFDDLTDAFVDDDQDRILLMVASGRAFKIENGARAVVIKRGFGKTKVRFAAGEHRGEEGWVPSEWVERR